MSLDLDMLLPREFDRDKLKWATVTDDTPLTIRLDGDTDPMLGTPDTCVAGLAVDDRVMVALLINDDPARKGRRAVVLCKAGGSTDAGLAATVADHETRLDTAETTLADHETRIDALEAGSAGAPMCEADTEAASGTTTSTGYTATLTSGTACGVAFVAPASGKVLIHNSVAMFNSGAANVTYCTVRLCAGASIGAGTELMAAVDDNSVNHSGTSQMRASVTIPIFGLTPGASYNLQQFFKVAAGTGTFLHKVLIVEGR